LTTGRDHRPITASWQAQPRTGPDNKGIDHTEPLLNPGVPLLSSSAVRQQQKDRPHGPVL